MAYNDVELTNKPETSKVIHEIVEEDFGEEEENFEFEELKPKLMKIINLNAQLCSTKAVAGTEEHYEELKAACEKFQRLLCIANGTKE